MAFSRRKFLVGVGGAVVGLPFLEGLVPKEARADAAPPPFALFYRRGNGVQQRIFDRNSYPSSGFYTQTSTPEPERWWPVMADGTTPYAYGALSTLGPVSAMNELESYVSKMTIVKGLRHPYGRNQQEQPGHRGGWAPPVPNTTALLGLYLGIQQGSAATLIWSSFRSVRLVCVCERRA